ncbi:alpha/beta fold hydrolase [Streptomyces sp. NPDC032198]|uniref:thioesterase II family protein n=1 Tax=Streptomyces sp. NPDC032198 TaxID=3155127 RepID=UPI0033D47ED3
MHKGNHDSELWIRRFIPVADPEVRLICFPHAGGSASFYHPFSRELSPLVEALAVQYPGRQDRRAEGCATDLADLADRIGEALTPWTDRPFALFGHSMGATLAYEVARGLEAAGRAPDALFVSARRAPHRNRNDGWHLSPDSDLIADLKALDGTGTPIYDDPEFLALILPVLRSDYRAAETYRHRPGPKLNCPITALAGDADPRVPVDELRHWGDHTAGRFDLQVFPGGHFYLTNQQARVLRVVIDRLLGVGAG